MAPELRTRKSKSAAEVEAEMPKTKVSRSQKRKAVEEAPASKAQKKAKPAAPAKNKETKSAVALKKERSKKSKGKESKSEVELKESETALVEREQTPDSVDYANDVIQQLAADMDGEEEDEEEPVEITEFTGGDDVGTIPPVPKKAKKAMKSGSKEAPGVVYVGRIPHGFYEHEMRQYFSQFGPTTNIRISRNKRTGASKHFAFIEFAEASTAEIVAKTMDNYLLFGHILKCKVVPPENVHEKIWEGANRRFKRVPWNKMAGSQLNRPLSESGWEKRVSKEKKRRSLREEKLKKLGYEFEAPKLKAVPAPAPTAVVETEQEE